jgi:hypothetical protein
MLSGHEFPIRSGAAGQVEPSTSDGYSVWQDLRDMRASLSYGADAW